MNLRAYLELVRLPNLFTAAADVLAAYLTVTVGLGAFNVEPLVWLLISTVCLYAGGVVLNDYFDEPIDRRERPERPLPSGRISRRSARRLVVGLFVFAGLSAASVGPISLALALSIALCASIYDAIGKRTAFGPLNMGLCRLLNFLLGASAVPFLLADRLTLALLLMVHVTGVTVVSRGEVWGAQRATAVIMLGAVVTVTASLLLLDVAGLLPEPSYRLFLAVFLLIVTPRILRLYRDPSARNAGLAVKWGVLGLVLLDAAFAAAYAGIPGGLAVASLILPSILIARQLAVT